MFRTGHEGPEWKQRYRPTHSLTSAQMVLEINATNRPLYSRHSLHRWLDRCENSRPPPEFNPRVVYPVVIRYTNYAILAHYTLNSTHIIALLQTGLQVASKKRNALFVHYYVVLTSMATVRIENNVQYSP